MAETAHRAFEGMPSEDLKLNSKPREALQEAQADAEYTRNVVD